MIDSKLFDELATRLSKVVPPELHTIHSDVEKNFRRVLQNYFDKLNLVTREEFDIQSKVLAKTRKKLEDLEQQLTRLSAPQDS